MSLSSYLASKYLSADPPASTKKSKKRKRKASALTIADDDALGWDDSKANSSDSDSTPVIAGTSRAFRKTTKSNWKVIGDSAETAAADAILAANTDGQVKDDDDEPTIANPEVAVEKMSSGAHAGLQTGAQVAAQMKAAQKAERESWAKSDPAAVGKGSETIYRDASGRIINIAMQRAEARKAAADEEAKAAREKELQKGGVQKQQEEERRKKLADAKYMGFSRYADDKELNEELKERDRWNDPAAAFLEKKKDGRSKGGFPVYQGSWTPNRFGIRPGHRWDGVDRGNGFEKKWFTAQNKKKNRAELEYQWQMDAD